MGSPADDTYYVNDPSIEIDEDIGGGVDTVVTTVSYTLRAGEEIEELVAGNRSASLRLTGNEFDNVIYGNTGKNTLDGGAGDDAMIGSGGDDTYRVDSRDDLVFEIHTTGGTDQGYDTLVATVNYALAAGVSVEVMQAGTRSTSLRLTGNEFSQLLIGNNGNNVLDGGSGVDTLQGGAGNDIYYVGPNRSYIVEASGAENGIDWVYDRYNRVDILYNNIENLLLLGNSTYAIGNNLNNIMIGNGANNIMNGLAGADTMEGMGGNDTYTIDNAGDMVIEGAGGGFDTVYITMDHTLAAGQQIEALVVTSGSSVTGLRLTGNEFGQSIAGTTGADRLDGRRGADSLNGGAGADSIDGGEGVDTLSGGEGADLFVFSTAVGAGVDTVLDFSLTDKFQLSQAAFSELGLGRLTFSAFKETSKGGAVDANDRILFDKSTGELAYDADGSGSAFSAVTFAVINTNRALVTYDDFTIV